MESWYQVKDNTVKISDVVTEKWSAKYKRSIDCNNPKGFSQRAHCAGRKKKKTESFSNLELAILEGGHDLVEWRADMKNKSVREQAAEYLGKSLSENLSKSDQRKITAKAQKIKVSEKKNHRKKVL